MARRSLLLLLLLHATVATTATTTTRNITGTTFPLVQPADSASPFPVIVTGTNFGTAADQPSDLICRVKTPDSEQPLPGPNCSARVINDTHINCTGLAGYITAGRFGVAVESASHSDPSKHIWWSHGTAQIEYRNLVEATPDRRPYLSDELDDAALLVAVNVGALRMFPATASATTLTVCATLTAKKNPVLYPGAGGEDNPYLPAAAKLDPALEGLALLPCQDFDLQSLAANGGAYNGDDLGTGGIYNTAVVSVPFDRAALSKLVPASMQAANLKVAASVVQSGGGGGGGGRYELAAKYRRFAVAPGPMSAKVSANQSVTVIDHRRRMVRVDGRPWLGVGFYVAGALTKYEPRGSTAYAPLLPLAKKTFGEMAREGMTQMMPYGMDSLHDADRVEILQFLDHDLNGTLKFDMPLVADVMLLLKSAVGSANYTKAWAGIEENVRAVRHSKSLFGYYICDDCDNAQSFPPLKMAQLYEAIKYLDPHHVVLGAPWAHPWSLSQYGDDAGFLSLDYMQVENYISYPAYHQQWDHNMRRGLYWEVLANSPPSYITEGDDQATGRDYGGEPMPPQIESTLSWLGAINYGAVNVVNFVIEPQFNRNSQQNGTHTPRILDMPSHINAQGNYARQATKLLDGLLPDLTDAVAGRPFDVAVLRSGDCPAKPTLPAYSGRPAVDFATQDSVAVKAIRQRWVDPHTKKEVYCAFVIVANLCPAPSPFAVGMPAEAIPADVTHARHHFDANYNVTLSSSSSSSSGSGKNGAGGQRTLEDVVPGYGTSVLRIGCDGWREASDGSGRVC